MKFTNFYLMASCLVLLSIAAWAVGNPANITKANTNSTYRFNDMDDDGPAVPQYNDRNIGLAERADVTKYPYSAGGYISDSGGWCSAQFVRIGPQQDRNRKYVLLTAAHCVTDNSTGAVLPANEIIFHQQYNKDANPKETASISIRKIFVPRQWSGNPHFVRNSRYDYAFLETLAPSKSGDTIPLDTSAAGQAEDRVEVIGYPSSVEGGYYMQKYATNKTNSTYDGVYQISPNVQGGGSSGGAWIQTINGVQYVVSDKSMSTDANTGIGPKYDDNVANLWNQAYISGVRDRAAIIDVVEMILSQ